MTLYQVNQSHCITGLDIVKIKKGSLIFMNDCEHRDIKQIITLLNSDKLVNEKKTDECVLNMLQVFINMFCLFLVFTQIVTFITFYTFF